MILCPPEWHEWRAGDVMLYARRPGPVHVHCVMSYQERVTPVRSFPTLLNAVLADDPEFQLVSKNKITRFVTDEGEYAAMITANGTYRDRKIAHIVASVFAEDFCTLLDARVEAEYLEAHAAMVFQLAKTDRLGLGVRRRRYGFSPPPGWHPVPGLGLEVVLLPPDYPSIHAAITIYPAEPIHGGIDPHLLQNIHDERVGISNDDEVCQAAFTPDWKRGKGLGGEEWTTRRSLPGDALAGKILRYFVVLRDERYYYAAKLETVDGPHADKLHETFVSTIGTIEPLPEANVARTSASDPFSMWIE